MIVWKKKRKREGMKWNSGLDIYLSEIGEVSKMDGGGDMGEVGNIKLGEGGTKRRYNLRRKGNGNVEGKDSKIIIKCIGEESFHNNRVEGDVGKTSRKNYGMDKDLKKKGLKGRKEEKSEKGKERVLREYLVEMEVNERGGKRRIMRKKRGEMKDLVLKNDKNWKGPMDRDLIKIKDKSEAPVIRRLRSGKNYMAVAPVIIGSCRAIFGKGDVGKRVDEKNEEGLFYDDRKSVGEKELWGEGKIRGNNEEDLKGEEIDVVGVGNDVKKKGDEVSGCYRKVEESRQNIKRKGNFLTDDEKEDENGKEGAFMRKEKKGKEKEDEKEG